ncbi:MAG: hypothetical protein ACW99A_15455, partial [Candidatus Kariarchaeaceae archaeon]
IISNLVRNGQIHFHNQILFNKEFWQYLKGQLPLSKDLENVFQKDRVLGLKVISEKLGLLVEEAHVLLKECIENQSIEQISPYYGVLEYRITELKKQYLPTKLKRQLVIYLVSELGPVDFKLLQSKCQEYFSFPRIELLILLSDLIEEKKLFTSLITTDSYKSLFYFNKEQKLILEDPVRKSQFDRWEIIEDYQNLFPHLSSEGSHLLLYHGSPILYFKVNRNIDYGEITTFKFIYNINEIDIYPYFEELIGFIENYIFSKGLRGVVIKKIEGNSPENWVNM